MIATTQKRRILTRVLDMILRRGRVPLVSEVMKQVSDEYAGRSAGDPIFRPIVVSPSAIVDPVTLTANLTDIREDINTVFENSDYQTGDVDVSGSGFAVEAGQLLRRLQDLSFKAEAYKLSALERGVDVITDALRSSDYIDLSRTTASIDYKGGKATLPPSTTSSGLHNMYEAVVISEDYTVKPITPFSAVFTQGQVWQHIMKKEDHYSATLNLTGKEVVIGHENEVEINHIELEALAPLTVGIETSVDGMNWSSIVSPQSVAGKTRWDFEPVWTLYLRVTITGEGIIGIKSLYIRKLICAESAIFQTKALSSGKSLYTLFFEPKVSAPMGTYVEHYWSESPDGPWGAINPGLVNLYSKVERSDVLGSFTTTDVPNLWGIALSSNSPAVIESATLNKGYQQFHVNSISFDWTLQGDPNHSPQLSDWGFMKGVIQDCYMSTFAAASTGTTVIPNGIAEASGTVLGTHMAGAEAWLSVAVASSGGLVLAPGHNYKFSTNLYLDREALINNGVAGLFTSNNLTGSPTSISWALYVNGVRVAYNSSHWNVSGLPVPSALAGVAGVNFQGQLFLGWNTVDLLVYVPSELISTNYQGVQAAILLRPDLFEFSLPTIAAGVGDTPMKAYPLWADKSVMSRVSEFYLKAISPPWERNCWAFRLDSEGQPSYVLLNYNPSDSSKTIDGRIKGSTPAYFLRYFVDRGTSSSFYYRAVLRRNNSATTTPSLNGYRFTTTRG